MQELFSKYNPKETEEKWLKVWQKGNFFHAVPNPNKKPFTIVIPPPNVTGVLHMGHALNNTLQDILIRYKRMNGFEALWMPGTDHAGIATQNVVEKQLAKEGKKRQDVGREEFLKKLWAWKKEYGDTIIHQLEKLGSSCDWPRTRFTMDDEYSEAVKEVFIRLYEKGLIYQGRYIINWCPRCQTALSDEEAEHQDKNGKLYYIKYPYKNKLNKFLIVATTRPETMLGDTAVAVNPKDDRYSRNIGETIVLPLVNREIPIIGDDFVSAEFGTGAVKVTPAHDPNDFMMGQRHNLPMINIMHPDARINEQGGKYSGLDRFEARKQVVADLEAQGLMEKIEDHRHAVGQCYRCDTVVEPYLSKQWFVKMKPLAAPALDAVKDGKIKIKPERFEKVYINWMEGIRDWCISRQIWWGHQIPVWHKRVNLTEKNWTQLLDWGWDHYIKGNWGKKAYGNLVIRIFKADGTEFDTKKDPLMPVIKSTEGEYDIYICTANKELIACIEKHGFKQDPDVLDTWFSSWLWPFATLGWPKDNEDLKYFYPTNTLMTASEILFFWVARMIMAGYEFKGHAPFNEVYIHGTVRDAKGRKMSKSLGNALDPLEIIEEYGADALRFSLIINSGQDIFISKEKFEIGRNFANKIWNASRLIFTNCTQALESGDYENIDIKKLDLPSRWILGCFYDTLIKTSQAIEHFRYSEGENSIQDFFWGNFCDWYLELMKSKFSDVNVQKTALFILKNSLKLMHPFIPFVTEEIYSKLNTTDKCLSVASWPALRPELIDGKSFDQMQTIIDVISAIRNIRTQWNVKANDSVDVVLSPGSIVVEKLLKDNQADIQKLGRIKTLTIDSKAQTVKDAASALVESVKVFIPLGSLVDLAAEKKRMGQEIVQKQKAIEGLQSRLTNEDFVSKAPADVISKEKERLASLQKEVVELNKVLISLS